jgi:capsid protein
MSILSRIKAASSIIFNGASTTQRQKSRTALLRDFKRELLPSEWRNITAYANQLYAQMGEIRGAIKEKATYVVGDAWIPQFYGTNKKWGALAESWLWEWMKVSDVRGYPYDFKKNLELASIGIDRSGDVACILTQASNNFPQTQFLPGQRIGNRNFSQTIVSTDGPYKGFPFYNGVVLNEFGRAIAYHVLGEQLDGSQDQFISARDMFLIYDPDWSDQPRGITGLYHAVLDLMDIQDIHGYTMHGIKMSSTIGLVEYNEDGERYSGSNRTTTTGDNTGIAIEDLNGGTTRIYKSNSGSKVETLNDDRPSPNREEFIEKTLRSAYQGLEWSYELARDASKLGGNPMRVILSKCARTVEKRQCLLRYAAIRIVGYAISKAIKNGDLPASDEWWKFDFQMPRIITGDAGREAQQDREDLKAGTRSLQEDAAERGRDWMELRDQIQIEAEDVLIRAQAISKSYNISMEIALNLLQQRNPNGNVPTSQPPPQTNQSNG